MIFIYENGLLTQIGYTHRRLYFCRGMTIFMFEYSQPTVLDCQFKGVQNVLLYQNQPSGGDIENPSDIIPSSPINVGEDVKRKLRNHVERMNRRQKRLGVQRRRTDMFDKAISVHEKALTLV